MRSLRRSNPGVGGVYIEPLDEPARLVRPKPPTYRRKDGMVSETPPNSLFCLLLVSHPIGEVLVSVCTLEETPLVIYDTATIMASPCPRPTPRDLSDPIAGMTIGKLGIR